MKNKTPIIENGTIHDIPDDLQYILIKQPDILDKRNNLSPLARNEWICWVISVKKPETRKKHLTRLCEEIQQGKKRPCCRPGCPHHNPKTQKWFK